MESVQVARRLGASLAISTASTTEKAEQALGALASGGTLAVVGYAGGRDASIDVTDIIWKALTVRGFTFRLFSPQTIAAAQQALLGYLAEGALKPTVAKVFPLERAHANSES